MPGTLDFERHQAKGKLINAITKILVKQDITSGALTQAAKSDHLASFMKGLVYQDEQSLAKMDEKKQLLEAKVENYDKLSEEVKGQMQLVKSQKNLLSHKKDPTTSIDNLLLAHEYIEIVSDSQKALSDKVTQCQQNMDELEQSADSQQEVESRLSLT